LVPATEELREWVVRACRLLLLVPLDGRIAAAVVD
jgi:hypothetical protein